ncbi:MAG: restriction endonuclease subunit S [Acidobacteriia bacterium]|nr:restriction endonuclease subunit S [Terriglobia bacterium]MYK11805.1 restriction endonuclease subunit S [Terriglobia bacterium]
MAKLAKIVSDLQPYPAYKPSGVEWLGDVPTHWEVEPNRALFEEVNERERPDEPLLSVTITQGVIRQTELLADSSKKDSSKLDKSSYKLVRFGDIAYNKMRAWQGAIGVSWDQGIVSPAYVVQRPRHRTNSQYMHHLFRTPAFAKEAERWSYGIASDMWSLRPEQFKGIYACLPPVPEQAAIARYLDYADRRIQRCIRAKQKLITLLEEQKQAIVHQAISGQIDVRVSKPYPSYKDSGVEWLGGVPEHWEVIRLGRLITLTTGFPFKSEGFTQSEEDVRLLRGINVALGRLRWKETVRWPADDTENFAEYLLEPGDIVLGMDRPIIQDGIRVALVDLSDVPSLLLQRVARIRPGNELNRDFAFLLLSGKGFSDYLAPIFTGVSVPHLSPEQIRGYRLALPSLAEQEQILEWLGPRIGAIRSGMDCAIREILLLREYRTRLTADVVTGKFDVREAAARLADEFDESDASGMICAKTTDKLDTLA